jgi:gas vesicle protein GvpA/GvpJ/GvpM family
MTRRRGGRSQPPRTPQRSTLSAKTTHTTVSARPLPKASRPPLRAGKPAAAPKPPRPPKRQVARIVADEESSLLDLIDNLLAKGVMLNADLVLALANVDLVYVRLSALLCAADRVLPVVART